MHIFQWSKLKEKGTNISHLQNRNRQTVGLTSAALEVDGIEAESTTQSSSMDIFADASVLFESLKLVESINCFRVGCLLLLPTANPCPLTFLQSGPNKLSCMIVLKAYLECVKWGENKKEYIICWSSNVRSVSAWQEWMQKNKIIKWSARHKFTFTAISNKTPWFPVSGCRTSVSQF